MAGFSKIKFGAGLVVSDEGAGVINLSTTGVVSGTWTWTTAATPATGRVRTNNLSIWASATQLSIAEVTAGVYWTFPLSYIASGGVPPANNRDTLVSFQTAGAGAGGGGGGHTIQDEGVALAA